MSTIVQTSVPLATKAAQFDDVSRPRIVIGHGNDGYWMESHNVRARLGELHSYVPTLSLHHHFNEHLQDHPKQC